MDVPNEFFLSHKHQQLIPVTTSGDEHVHLPLECKKRFSLLSLSPFHHVYFPCTSEKPLEIKQLNGGGRLWCLQDQLPLLLSCGTLNLSAFHCFISPISKTQALISWVETLWWKGLGESRLFSVVWSPGLAVSAFCITLCCSKSNSWFLSLLFHPLGF